VSAAGATSEAERVYAGKCHCGACGFEFHTRVEPDQWTLRECQCSFCRAHASKTVSDPAGSLQFYERQADAMQRYRFGLRTADFLLCGRCGVYLGALIETARGSFGIANTHALSMPAIERADGRAVNYDDERSDQRIARREQLWTPASFVVSGAAL
jgi:hypothetical protein